MGIKRMNSSRSERRKLTVTSEPGLPTTPEGDKERIDHYLGRQFEDLSRSRVEALIKEGAVLVDGHGIKGSRPALPGQVIVLTVPPVAEPSFEPEAIPLDIRYEDPYLIVVNKAPGMVVHPAPGHPAGTLVNALLHHCSDLSGIGGIARPGLIHRLDMDTSGLIVVAKNHDSHLALAAAMKERRIVRLYLSVVWGHPEPEEGTIQTWMGRSRYDRKRMAVFTPKTALRKRRWGRPGEEKRMLGRKGESQPVRSGEELQSGIGDDHPGAGGIPRGAREAVTHYRTISSYDLASLLECKLETGRTHQIRVHMSHRGHPVLGDPVYGGRENAVKGMQPERRTLARSLLELMPRQALHAFRLQFTHPVSGLDMDIEAELPMDFRGLMEKLKEIH